jgi:hypothetical protein
MVLDIRELLAVGKQDFTVLNTVQGFCVWCRKA